jgi:hypothetical protein
MRLFLISSALVCSVFAFTCYAGSVKPNRTVTDNVISGEYVVVINNAELGSSIAQKELQAAIGKCEVKMISKNIAHIILDPKNDPGLEKIKSLLSKLKWVKAVEQNKEVHIS